MRHHFTPSEADSKRGVTAGETGALMAGDCDGVFGNIVWQNFKVNTATTALCRPQARDTVKGEGQGSLACCRGSQRVGVS